MTTPDTGEDELTELVDANFPRVDLVGKGANGIPRFLIAKQDGGSAGLLEPDFVRDLIGKTQPDPSGRERVAMPSSGVTLSGSPADIAAFIHKAAQRAGDPAEPGDAAEIAKALAEYEAIVKEKYSAADRKTMAGNGQAMKDGSYPIKDESDLDHAIKAVGRGGADHDAIRRHVIARAKSMGKSSKIPDNWAADGSLKEGSVSKAAVAKDAGDVLDAQMDDGMDGLDPTVPLAAPDEDVPGDPTDPGSPAWEAIDAATACKWTSILSRARVAIDLLGEREMLEAASADPDDQENAWDMQDVCCAIDYAISVLAPYAVAEQSEADCGTDAMAAIGKAAASLGELPMDELEALARVRKAGRVLSSANEAKIRDAAASLEQVLSSLPQAPDSGQPVAKQKEAAMAADQAAPAAGTAEDSAPVAKDSAPTPEAQAADTGPVNLGGTTGLGEPRVTGPDGALPADGPQQALPGDAPGRQVIKSSIAAIFDQEGRLVGVTDPASIVQKVEKADGEKPPMQAVFDQNGDLIGIVDPASIQPVTGAGKGKPDDGADAGEPKAADGKSAEAGDAADLEAAPPADAGTPSGGVATDDDVAKSAADGENATSVQEVLKSIVTEAVSAALDGRTAAEDIVSKADVAGLAGKVEDLLTRVAKVEEQPAAPKVFTNGQTPPAHQLRGQDQGSQPVDVAKARDLKHTLYNGSGPEQAAAFHEMERMAISQFDQIRRGAPQSPAAPR